MALKSTSVFVEKAIERLDRLDRAQVELVLRGLRREREFLQDVFDRLTEGVLVVDREWQVKWLNRAARGLLGLEERRRLIGEKVFELPIDSELLACLRRFTLQHKDVVEEEVIVRVPKDRIVSLTLVAGDHDKSAETGCVMIVEDLTERRIEQARRQEAEKIASLATLTAGVAHEIKNPLNSLQIHAQLLERTLKEGLRSRRNRERVGRSVEVILEEIARLAAVVEEFLTAARPTRPDLRPRRLNAVIERLAGIVKPELDEKGIELALDLEPNHVELQMDERQLVQALINVVRNAIEAIEAKRRDAPEAEGSIEITTRADNRHVWILITDTGCGIAREDLQRVFEPYYTTKFSGTGLGLMIVYRIVHEHGGSLDLQSEVDLGTTVTIGLPLKRQMPRTLAMKPQSEMNGESARTGAERSA